MYNNGSQPFIGDDPKNRINNNYVRFWIPKIWVTTCDPPDEIKVCLLQKICIYL